MLLNITQRLRDDYSDMHDIHYYYSEFPRPGLYVTIKVGDWFHRSWLADCTEGQGETIATGLQDGLVRASISMAHDRYINNWQAYNVQLVRDRIEDLQRERDKLVAKISVREQQTALNHIRVPNYIYPIQYV